MRVKMLVSRVGVDVTYNAGSEYDLPDERAQRWIDGAFAEAVGEVTSLEPAAEITVEPSAVEVAVSSPTYETTAKRGRLRK